MKRKKAFTMAEILISLGIVGVIAGITLPVLHGNVDSKKWVTQRLALYSRMSQALNAMPGLNGYGIDAFNAENTRKKAATAFIIELGKVYKMNNVCDSDGYENCGLIIENGSLKNVTNLSGNVVNVPVGTWDAYLSANGVNMLDNNATGIKPAAFETAAGESILVQYNPYCAVDPRKDLPANSYDMYNKVCVNMIYDLNGTNAPNAIGKDIGIMTAIYSVDSVVVAPMPFTYPLNDSGYKDAMVACANGAEVGRLPNLEEGISMKFNNKLLTSSIQPNATFWTNTFAQNDNAWTYGGNGVYTAASKADTNAVWCVKQ